MKKLFLGFVAFILAIFAVGAIFAYLQFQKYDRMIGLSEAPPIAHERFITPQTRTQLVLNPAGFKGFIERHLPPTVQIPEFIERFYTIIDLLNMAAPHRIALLAHTDYMRGVIHFTAFVNERMGGPFIVEQANTQNVLQQVQDIEWGPAGISLLERGIITVDGTLSLPEGLDVAVLEKATLGGPQIVKEISGEHLFELVIDNGNAELMTLTGLAMEGMGVDWKNVFGAQEFRMALPLFNKISVARLHGDMVTDDEMSIHLRVEALPETEFIFNMIKSMGMPEIQRYLREIYNLVLEGDGAWSKEESAFIGNYTLKGVEQYLAIPFQNL